MTSVTTFGAGNGADDTAAINAALAASDGEVYFPPGVYTISGSLNIPPRPTHLRGAGPEISIIKSVGTGYDAVLADFSSPNAYYTAMPLQITGITIGTTVNNPGAAIRVTYFDLGVGSSVNEETLILRDVVVRPEESTAPVSFGTGIALSGCWNAVLDNVVIHGENGALGMQCGISLDGNSLDVNISNFRIMNAANGIRVSGRCEGTLIHHGWIISNSGSTNGIVVSTRPGTPTEPNKPWLSVNDTHISVSQFGIFIENHPQCSLTNNLIYKWGAKFFRGIWLEGSAVGGGGMTSISGNKVISLGSGQTDGIVVNVPNCTITGNIVSGIPITAIWLAPAAQGCVVVGNAVRAQDIHNAGAGNTVACNL